MSILNRPASAETQQNMAPLRIDNIVLRLPCEGDIQARLRIGRDAELVRLHGGDPQTLKQPTLDGVEKWYEKALHAPHTWVIDVDKRYVGTTRLHSINEQDRRARYAISIQDSTKRGQGVGTKVTKLILHYAFDRLLLHRVDLRVLDFNHRAIACYRKCGFVEEGIERETYFSDGEWHNDTMMSILEDEYRNQFVMERG